MKNILLKGVLFIILGFMLGNYIFGTKIKPLKSLYNKEIYYFLQEGVYSNEDTLKNNLRGLTQKVVDYNNDKYYVYVGITKDLEVAEKLKKIYEDKGIKVYQKEKNVTSEEFSNNVEQFDLLIKATTEEDEILTIEEVVLANYDEIFKKE